MDRYSQFFTVMHYRTCEETDLTGFFIRRGGYGMPGSPVFRRSARIDQPADQPVNPERMENLANYSETRTARHGRNPLCSGIYTFFSPSPGSQDWKHQSSNPATPTKIAVTLINSESYDDFIHFCYHSSTIDD
jgi:hypothetical protein